MRKGLDVRTFTVDPVVRLHYVEVTPPELASPTGDLARLFEALEREWQLTGLEADLEVIRALQPALEKGTYGVTVAVHGGRQVIGVWPGLHETAYGVAIDIGSTTIAGHLADLADGAVLASNGVMNPQIRFGEDLMSRVSYAMMHPEGAGEMTAAVRKALDGLIASLAMRAGIKRVDILELALVGNPIMHHLLLGIDPTPLGGAPFALATDRAVNTTAAELGLLAHPGARVYVLPCIAGHVGADTAGVILAEEPHLAERMTLVVDVGTNAEIVLGDRRRLLAASSPTGPAFEGAQISGGQRAAPGAIERVRIDRETLEPRFRVIGVDAWSDEPDFAAGIADTGDQRHLRLGDHRGRRRDVPGRDRHRGRRHRRRDWRPAPPRIVPDGRTFSYVLHAGDGSGTSPRIAITQNDVRAIQLAKAALYAGVRLLMDQLAIDEVDEIRLAGAFGSQIDPTPRDDPRAHPGLRPRPRPVGRQRRRDRGAHRAAVRRGADRDRRRRPPGREDRDRRRAALPAALRRGDGLPAQDRRVPASRGGGRPAGTRAGTAPRRPRTPATSAAAAGAWRSAPERTPDGRPDIDDAVAVARRARRCASRPTRSTSRS